MSINTRKRSFLEVLLFLSDDDKDLNVFALRQEAKSKKITLEELCRIRYVGTYNDVMEKIQQEAKR